MTTALIQQDIAVAFSMLQGLGLSQRGIAARTGQAQSEVCEVLAGRRIRSYDVLARIARGLGVPRGLLGLSFTEPADPPSAADLGGEVAVCTIVVRHCARCAADPEVDTWTGHETKLLRQAMRMTVRYFAQTLGVAGSTVCKWEAGGRLIQPRPDKQARLDQAFLQASAGAKHRFGVLLAATRAAATAPAEQFSAKQQNPRHATFTAGPGGTRVDGPTAELEDRCPATA